MKALAILALLLPSLVSAQLGLDAAVAVGCMLSAADFSG